MLGVINGTAPNPVRLAEMCDHLGNVLGRPSWLPVPEFALKAVLGEGAFVVRMSLFSCHSLACSWLFQLPINNFQTNCRFLKGKGWCLLEPKNWVSHSNTAMWRMHLKPLCLEAWHKPTIACMHIASSFSLRMQTSPTVTWVILFCSFCWMILLQTLADAKICCGILLFGFQIRHVFIAFYCKYCSIGLRMVLRPSLVLSTNQILVYHLPPEESISFLNLDEVCSGRFTTIRISFTRFLNLEKKRFWKIGSR